MAASLRQRAAIAISISSLPIISIEAAIAARACSRPIGAGDVSAIAELKL